VLVPLYCSALDLKSDYVALDVGMETIEHAPAGSRKSALTNNQLVYEHLHAGLISGRIVPGAKMSIAALAEEMRVSAGAVREALAKLEAQGLVMSESQRGYRATPISEQDLIQLVDARIAIEKLCLAEAIKHGDLKWEGSIVAALHRLSRLHERDADKTHVSAEWAVAHSEYHHAIVAGCPNVWLRRIQAMLYQQSERYRQLAVTFTGATRDVAREHQDLLDALLRRDTELAQLLISQHLRTTADLLLSSPLLSKPTDQAGNGDRPNALPKLRGPDRARGASMKGS
jgi:GntR family carbon starvation induced transcriptional regulator